MEEKKSNKREGAWAKKLVFSVLIVLIGFLIFYSGYASGQRGLNIGLGPKNVINTDSGKSTNVDFSVFWEAWDKLKQRAVEEPDSEKMVQGSISGMLASIGDPYTTYFTKEQNQRFRDDIQGEFDGIGVELILKNNLPTVVAPLSDTPAEKAGIRAGDVIIEVDGTKTSEIGFEKTVNTIRGAKGTKVKLTIVREGVRDPLTFEIERSTIVVRSVEWRIDKKDGKNIGYIKIRQFGDDTDSLFLQAADHMVKNKPDSIVLDLRNDPGGYLETAVNISSYFIKDGIVVTEKGRGGATKDYKTTKTATLSDFPVVVLINGGSASASEIVTGALKDRRGSKLIGEKTFGKGSVQELIDLSDGSAVKITIAKWFTPNGTQINGEGIKPDIEVIKPENSSTDTQLQRAEEYIVNGK